MAAHDLDQAEDDIFADAAAATDEDEVAMLSDLRELIEEHIETLTRQVSLSSQCHIGIANTATRLSITTAHADRAATAAAKGHLPMTSDLETGIGFLCSKFRSPVCFISYTLLSLQGFEPPPL